MAKPPFSNNKFSLEGMRDQNGQLMELKVSAWVNPSKDDRDDMEKQKLAAHVSQLIIDNDLTMRLQVEHRSGPDYNAWPTLGYFNLFPNKNYSKLLLLFFFLLFIFFFFYFSPLFYSPFVFVPSF